MSFFSGQFYQFGAKRFKRFFPQLPHLSTDALTVVLSGFLNFWNQTAFKKCIDIFYYSNFKRFE